LEAKLPFAFKLWELIDEKMGSYSGNEKGETLNRHIALITAGQDETLQSRPAKTGRLWSN
jgi:hypothetical protein